MYLISFFLANTPLFLPPTFFCLICYYYYFLEAESQIAQAGPLTLCIAKDDFELLTLLSLPPKGWDSKRVPPCPVSAEGETEELHAHQASTLRAEA